MSMFVGKLCFAVCTKSLPTCYAGIMPDDFAILFMLKIMLAQAYIQIRPPVTNNNFIYMHMYVHT